MNDRRILELLNKTPKIMKLFNQVIEELDEECKSEVEELLAEYNYIRDELNDEDRIMLSDYGIDFEIEYPIDRCYIRLFYGDEKRVYKLSRECGELIGYRENYYNVRERLNSTTPIVVYDKNGDILAKNFIEEW